MWFGIRLAARDSARSRHSSAVPCGAMRGVEIPQPRSEYTVETVDQPGKLEGLIKACMAQDLHIVDIRIVVSEPLTVWFSLLEDDPGGLLEDLRASGWRMK